MPLPRSSQFDETPALQATLQAQRRRQLRGLLWLALLAAAGSLLRTAMRGELHHLILTPGWWRIW